MVPLETTYCTECSGYDTGGPGRSKATAPRNRQQIAQRVWNGKALRPMRKAGQMQHRDDRHQHAGRKAHDEPHDALGRGKRRGRPKLFHKAGGLLDGLGGAAEPRRQ